MRALEAEPAQQEVPARAWEPLRWLIAAAQTARPRQWPKNLLVFAAPLAGASLGRDGGLWYALGAAAAFIAASAAVYYVNDVIDAGRDRQHPVKRFRPVASGRLPAAQALALASLAAVAAVSFGFWAGEPRLSGIIVAYLATSMLYALWLKHVPVVEVLFVASGFVFRALGGAVATHVPASGWFLLVCSLGALMVAVAKRYTELSLLGDEAARHRPVMRWYTLPRLRVSERLIAAGVIVSYLLWAAGGRDGWMRVWHLASALPLAAALVRFDRLTGQGGDKPVEDLIARDWLMVGCEMAWLVMFALGL
ncbi:MAG TPA: decaprenyl-phosphate phosphoribosyltransferase [Streptosporangiaceae bacterium]|nr:decaprenyl-phosphate phosphoribosyltransferase [Streptosporangiaceae bacterium]